MLYTSRYGRRTIDALSDDTLDASLDEMSSEARRLFENRNIVPAHFQAKHTTAVDRLLAIAYDAGLTTLRDLADRAAPIIAAAARIHVEELHQFTSKKSANRAHAARNTCAALISGYVVARGEDPTATVALLPEINTRRGSKGRPLTNDEIILARLMAESAFSWDGRRTIPALQYVMVEAGAWPSETILVTGADLDDIDQPATLAAKGVNQRALDRLVPLDPWEAHHIGREARNSASLYPGAVHAQRIAFTGMSANRSQAASAAVNTSLARFLEDAGITDPTVCASSPLKWRTLKTMKDTGILSAMAASGHTKPETFARWLHLPAKAVRGLPARVLPPGR